MRQKFKIGDIVERDGKPHLACYHDNNQAMLVQLSPSRVNGHGSLVSRDSTVEYKYGPSTNVKLIAALQGTLEKPKPQYREARVGMAVDGYVLTRTYHGPTLGRYKAHLSWVRQITSEGWTQSIEDSSPRNPEHVAAIHPTPFAVLKALEIQD